MRHRQAGRHLGRDSAHRKALYRNLVTDLLRYERLTTTEAKAKEIRPLAEKIITLGKRGDVHARRQALRFVYDKHVVEHVFEDIAPRMASRPGGYLRITALEPRKGDGALMASIELVDYADDGGLLGAPSARPAATLTTAAPAESMDDMAAVDSGPAAATVEPVGVEEEESSAPDEDAAEDEPAGEEAGEPVAEAAEEDAPAAEAGEPAEASVETPGEEEDEKDGAS